jgi:hypothetical protein
MTAPAVVPLLASRPRPRGATPRRAGVALVALLLALPGCKGEPTGTPDPEPRCGYHADCPEGQVCFKGQCYGTATCTERDSCDVVPVCAGGRCFCSETERACLPVCEVDGDCPSDGHCINGVCKKYPVKFDAPAPGGGARRPLEVGIATVDLDFPMGVSMAGYASRRGPETPYRDALGGSEAWHDRPRIHALAFDDGVEPFVLVRLPLGWSEDFLLTETALKVQAKIGVNLSDRIITSATHSHSQPARFWHLVTGLNFGVFGYDEFAWEVFDRLTDSFAEAVVAAWQAKTPARFGWTMLPDFDPGRRVHRDRRGQNDGLPGDIGADPRLLLMRVDDLEGRPRAILTNFGMHGTVFDSDSPILTGDAPGGVETMLELRASARYGRPVTSVYLQGNAGDISPGGDDRGHDELERVALIGERVWTSVEAAFDGIQTRSDVALDLAIGRFPISYDILGYTAPSFRSTGISCPGGPEQFRYGAFQCLDDGRFSDRDPMTKYTDGDLACVFSLECLTNGYPVPNFMKTRVAVLRLGDLALATLPGEPVSSLGLNNSTRVKAALPGVREAFTLGYSMDHHFYLLTEEDWFQGGYEPSRDIWGWKFAPYFVDQVEKLAKELAKPKAERAWDAKNVKPLYWDRTEESPSRVPATETEGAPTDVVTEAPARAERLSRITFAWKGGHPGVDRPTITLEREVGGAFVPVEHAGGLPYTDAYYPLFVRYSGRCTRSTCARHTWSVAWEEDEDFPLGRYRFAVRGTHWKDGARVPYEVRSGVVELVGSSGLALDAVAVVDGAIEGIVALPPLEGAHLMRSVDTPARFGGPLEAAQTVTATATIEGLGEVAGTVTLTPATVRRGNRDVTLTRFRFAAPGAAAGAALRGLALRSSLGNRGALGAR